MSVLRESVEFNRKKIQMLMEELDSTVKTIRNIYQSLAKPSMELQQNNEDIINSQNALNRTATEIQKKFADTENTMIKRHVCHQIQHF